MSNFHFTFENLKKQYIQALELGYEVIRCKDYAKTKKQDSKSKVLVNRVDVDFSLKKARIIGDIFNALNIKGTFFIRLHAPEYNPFSFENYRVIKYLIETGHEIGYHSEVIDIASIWNEDEVDCLRRDIDVMNRMFNIEIQGIASHGGMTGLNNLDFWKNRKPADFGMLYEAYDKEPSFNLFQEAFYISDSEWIRWKCYNKGQRVEGDYRTFSQHLMDDHPLICLLIHSDTYFYTHFYE